MERIFYYRYYNVGCFFCITLVVEGVGSTSRSHLKSCYRMPLLSVSVVVNVSFELDLYIRPRGSVLFLQVRLILTTGNKTDTIVTSC